MSQRSTTSDTDQWIARAARFGYAAKGVVYLIIGGLAASAAFTARGASASSEGALATIVRQPFGRVALSAVAVGLAGYAVWRVVQALFDPEDHGGDLHGATLRVYDFVSALIHGSLVIAAVRMILDKGFVARDSQEASSQAGQVMSMPFGRWIVGVVGLVIVGSAVYQFVRAYKASFEKRLDMGRLNAVARGWVRRIGRLGLTARGVTFAIVGTFLLVAALRADPEQARGLAGALRTLEQQPYGPWLLAVVAVGLMAYGVHQLVKARLRRIGTVT